MAFFDDLGKKISQGGQAAIQKSKELAEVAKLNSLISDEEKNINNNYFQIGKLYASIHKMDCEDDFRGMINTIQESEKKIADYKEQVKVIKGIVKCEKCGGEVALTSAFCNSCGAPMPKRVPVKKQDENTIICDSCGKSVKKGLRFCTACGSTMTQVKMNNSQLTKICPACGFETTDDETLFCNSCGTKLTLKTKQISSQDVNSSSSKVDLTVKKCSNCGFETTDQEIAFCTECGSKLN